MNPSRQEFRSIPKAFSKSDVALQNAIKVQGIGTATTSWDKLLIDLRDMDPLKLDSTIIIRDCDFLKNAIIKEHESIVKVIQLLQQGKPNDLKKAFKIVREKRLREDDAIDADGGMIQLAIAVAALLLAGCLDDCDDEIETPPEEGECAGHPCPK